MPIYACQIGAVNILPMVRKYLDWQRSRCRDYTTSDSECRYERKPL